MKWPRLFEIEDKPWLPTVVRNQITDALGYLIADMQVYDPIIPKLLLVLHHSSTKKVVDLCSGATGPWQYIVTDIQPLEKYIEQITLTDLYPNIQTLQAFSQRHTAITYKKEPVNALDIAPQLKGVRTLFSSFHHFDTLAATSILQNAVDARMPICIFEFTERRLLNFILMPFVVCILFIKLLFTKPLTPSRLLFSYIIPIVPLLFLWDCMVSHLHSYSQEDLKDMLNNITNAQSYTWDVGEARSYNTPVKNIYLIGYPKI